MNKIFIADSFLVNFQNGVAHSIKFLEHLNRFRDSIHKVFELHDLALTPRMESELNDFILNLPHNLHGAAEPMHGAAESMHNAAEQMRDSAEPMFPRLECFIEIPVSNSLPKADAALKFNLLKRAAPALTKELFVSHFVTKEFPLAQFKGPNIAAHKRLNEQHGGEVLLTSKKGNVLETTTASLVWFEKDTLYAVPKKADRVQSVTESTVFEIARELGIETAHKNISVNKLVTREVFALNALHGIRRAKFNALNDFANKNDELLLEFQKRYQKLTQPITG